MLRKAPLHRVHLTPSVAQRAGRQRVGRRQAGRVIHHQRDQAHALGRKLCGDLQDRQTALRLLPARHRNGVVVQDFISDCRTRRDGLPDREQA